MRTTELRRAIKAVDPEARVSTWGTNSWTIRTENKLDEIRAALAPLGLEEQQHDVEGSRWDWTYVLIVASSAAKKSPKRKGGRGVEEAELTFRHGKWTAKCGCRNKLAQGRGRNRTDAVAGQGDTPEEAVDSLVEMIPYWAEKMK